jgi:hypothetical protein
MVNEIAIGLIDQSIFLQAAMLRKSISIIAALKRALGRPDIRLVCAGRNLDPPKRATKAIGSDTAFEGDPALQSAVILTCRRDVNGRIGNACGPLLSPYYLSYVHIRTRIIHLHLLSARLAT